MHDHTHPEHTAMNQADPELARIADALDRMAAADRAEPDGGFEARLAAATRPGVLGTIKDKPTFTPARALRWAAPLVAAAAALTLGFALPGAPEPTPEPRVVATTISLDTVESDLEAFLFIDELAGSRAVLTDTETPAGSSDQAPADELMFELLTAEGSTL